MPNRVLGANNTLFPTDVIKANPPLLVCINGIGDEQMKEPFKNTMQAMPPDKSKYEY